MSLKTSLLKLLGKINWEWAQKLKIGRVGRLTVEQKKKIWEILAKHHCAILTRRETHLSTYGIMLAHFVLTTRAWIAAGFKGPKPKFAFYSHALVNIEETDTPENPDDFELVEAIGVGVVYSDFEKVFNCDHVCLMLPPWDIITEIVQKKIGTKYDFELNPDDQSEMSCVELVDWAIKQCAPNPEAHQVLDQIKKRLKNIDPQSLKDCGLFTVLYEV